jgi:ribokinase
MADSIIVVGSSNTDMIIKMARIPRPGETIIGGQYATAAGGKGANQAVGAARAGGRVTLLTRVGQDTLGDAAIAGFERDGINVEHVIRDEEEPSGVALIFVGADGENSIGVASGANARLCPADIDQAAAVFDGAGIVLMQLETPLETIMRAAEVGAEHGLTIILNPAPARALPESLLKQVSILTPNETEAEMLTGIAVNSDVAAAQAAGQLLAAGVGAVIITLGARGVFVADGELSRLVTGFKVHAVDTTAAGDTFNGALAVALAEGQPLLAAARFACAAAAISVTRLGAQTSAPTRSEIDTFLSMNADVATGSHA